jgi:hypothetical protein
MSHQLIIRTTIEDSFTTKLSLALVDLAGQGDLISSFKQKKVRIFFNIRYSIYSRSKEALTDFWIGT